MREEKGDIFLFQTKAIRERNIQIQQCSELGHKNASLGNLKSFFSLLHICYMETILYYSIGHVNVKHHPSCTTLGVCV